MDTPATIQDDIVDAQAELHLRSIFQPDEERPEPAQPVDTAIETLASDEPGQIAEPIPDESTDDTAPDTAEDVDVDMSYFPPPPAEDESPVVDTTDPATECEPPPDEPTEEAQSKVPEWVTYEDDLTVPDEEEIKEIQGTDADMSAVDFKALEQRIYSDVDDPEQRPIKKLRLSWHIKGVRGTKERPNYARVLNSPYAYVDGLYWHIKFFPRGNKSTSVSAYIKCSRDPPKPDEETVESQFSVFEAEDDATFSQDDRPRNVVTVCATALQAKEQEVETAGGEKKEQKQREEDNDTDTREEPTAGNAEQSQAVESSESGQGSDVEKDEWRVSAQLGMVIYNPAEPRTGTYMSSEHQFNRHNDDWGWTNFVGPWNEIHIRQRGERQALLRNDQITIDAYIRIFADPSQALWWHESDGERYWDSKSLAGYWPMGTPPLYHSPAVAGITAWLLLAPFRKVIESVDTGMWRYDTKVKPQPFLAQLQIILYLMRTVSDETYVNVFPAIEALSGMGEEWSDVNSFWEVFRRAIELELRDHSSRAQIARIFDSVSATSEEPIPALPVKGVVDIQDALEHALQGRQNMVFPDFLPLTLDRQSFDKNTREWKLHLDRVRLNEKIDLSKWSTGTDAKYTLYGFIVHVGERNSNRFYSILRPDGPKTKWLAFEDGDGNKIFSYTKHKLQDYEGLEGTELEENKLSRQTAYLAMYIRDSCHREYLPGGLAPYTVPEWLRPYIHSSWQDSNYKKAEESQAEEDEKIDVEVYSHHSVVDRTGLLDMYNIKDVPNEHLRNYKLKSTMTFKELRALLADDLHLDEIKRIRLWIMRYEGVGKYTTANMESPSLKREIGSWTRVEKPLWLWMHVLDSDEELEKFGLSDPTPEITALASNDESASVGTTTQNDETTNTAEGDAQVELSSSATTADTEIAGPDAEQTSVQEAVAAFAGGAGSFGSDQGVTTIDAVVEFTEIVRLDIASIARAQIDAQGQDVFVDNDAVIASLIAADMQVADFVQSNDTPPPSEPAPTLAEDETTTPPQPDVPVPHMYGFLQYFDVHAQNFKVISSIIAPLRSNVHDTVQTKWQPNKPFRLWRRESSCTAISIKSSATFSDIFYSDGVDIIIGDVLSEDEIARFKAEGKFTDPALLSRYLWMSERKHPVLSVTSTSARTIAPFGGDYYCGPLVRGQHHGDSCTLITSNGHQYTGPLMCGLKHTAAAIDSSSSNTTGTLIYPSGDEYTGHFVQDLREGQGTLVEARTMNKYVGGWKDDKRHGKGVTHWEVAEDEKNVCRICFTNEIEALFYECGHVVSCVDCAKQCESCPICRRSVRAVVKMYRV